MPLSPNYRPEPRFADLPEGFYDAVKAASFPKHTLRFRNQRWAERVGLGELSAEEWEQHFARFEPLPDNLREPLALRYHGHQFRHYNPDLGDGRGFLHAQLRDDRGRLLDLATKGSGQTPWSRRGDGRLTLKGGVREILATERLEALGVSTSKTFSLFETGEELIRSDEPSPTRSCVMVRLGHSHVRFGSFQRHAHVGDLDRLKALVDFSLRDYGPSEAEAAQFDDGEVGDREVDPAAMLLRLAVARSAKMCADWTTAGFVHGVLNTDNMNVTGESFDYGPYRWLPTLDLGFTAAYFDHSGLYAFGNQPDAVAWNLHRLAETLSLICPAEPLKESLEMFSELFHPAVDASFLRRLGLLSLGAEQDGDLRKSAFNLLAESKQGFEDFFFRYFGGLESDEGLKSGGDLEAEASEPDRKAFETLLRAYGPVRSAPRDHAYFKGSAPCTLLIEEIEEIWSAIDEQDDWEPLNSKVEAIRQMGEALSISEDHLR